MRIHITAHEHARMAAHGAMADTSRGAFVPDFRRGSTNRMPWHSDSLAGAATLAMPLGRLLFSLIFLVSTPLHFTSALIDGAAQHGVPFASFVVPMSGLLAGAGALSVLLGYHARIGALMLVLFLVPVTFMMHNWWAMDDPMQRQIQQGNFFKNLGLLGGAIFMMKCGSGAWSLDNRLK